MWEAEKKQQEELKSKLNDQKLSKIMKEVNAKSMHLLKGFTSSTSII